MSHSMTKFYIHLVFSTKDRKDLIRESETINVYKYMFAILKQINCPAIRIGGTANHIHILYIQNKDQTVSTVAEKLKASTSKWMKTLGRHYALFAWQTGYAAFSVSQSGVQSVIEYIDNQKEHHRKFTFIEELKMFLEKYGIKYNEKYL